MKPLNIRALWEEHKRCEFELKDAEATMATMTAQPMVLHTANMLGGCGYDEVYNFYKHYFIPKMPKQIEITQLSCTVDNKHLVEEQIFSFVHDSDIYFMLPNIQPTGKTVHVPLVVIVYVEEGKVAKEHIYWDQATALKQVGLLDVNVLPTFTAAQVDLLK